MSDIVIRTRVDAKGTTKGLGDVKKEVQDLGKTGPKAVQPLTKDFNALRQRLDTMRHSMRGVTGSSETLQEAILSLSGKGLVPLLAGIVAVRGAYLNFQRAAKLDPELASSVANLRSEWSRFLDELSLRTTNTGLFASINKGWSSMIRSMSDSMEATRNSQREYERLLQLFKDGRMTLEEYGDAIDDVNRREKDLIEQRRNSWRTSLPLHLQVPGPLGPDYAPIVDRMLANDAAALKAGPPAPPGWRPPEAPPFSMGLEELSDIYFPRQHQRRTSPMPDFTADQLEDIERIKDAQAEALSEWSDGYQRMATNMENAIVGAFQAGRGGVDQLGQYAFDVIYESLAKAIAKAFVGNLLGTIGSIGPGAVTGGGSAAVGGVPLGGGMIGLGGSQTIGGLQVANQLRSQRVG